MHLFGGDVAEDMPVVVAAATESNDLTAHVADLQAQLAQLLQLQEK